MGKATTRITAENFLTPPEFAPWSLARDGAGRIGGVRLQILNKGKQTYLADCYQQVPLRVLPIGFGPAQPSLIYLLNPTAGLFDGDAQLVQIQAGPKSRAMVTGQSATRIHPCINGFSTQQWHITIGNDAILVILPGPAIPFHDCRYYQRVVVNLAEGAHFIWGDLWLPGRYARGKDSERFQFRTIIQDLSVRRTGRLIFRDRFCWQGPWDEATAAWHFGGENAFGSLYSTIDGRVATPSIKKTGFFQTAENNSCYRWLGPASSVTAALTKTALTLAAQAEGGAEPWFLTTHNLAPNHWFLNQPVLNSSLDAIENHRQNDHRP